MRNKFSIGIPKTVNRLSSKKLRKSALFSTFSEEPGSVFITFLKNWPMAGFTFGATFLRVFTADELLTFCA